MKKNHLQIAFLVFSFLILVLFSLSLSSVKKLIFFNRAAENQLSIQVKLQGEYDKITGATFKTKVALYSASGLVKEYTNISLTKDHQSIFKLIIDTSSLNLNQMYAVFIKPDKYLGKLFCSPTSFSADCKTPQIIITSGAGNLDLTQGLLFSGDISPQDGKIAANDISAIINQIGQVSATNNLTTDINSDGMTQTVDYSLSLYSLSKNYVDDPIPSTWVTTPTPIPTISGNPTAIPTQTPTPTPTYYPGQPTFTPVPTLTIAPILTPTQAPTLTPTRIPTQIPTLTPTPTTIIVTNPEAVTRKVMVIDFNPVIESQGNKKVRDLYSWANPINLESQYINDIKVASGGYLNYRIVLRMDNLNLFPTKNNGYVFTDSEYMAAINNPTENARALINYNKVLSDYGVCEKLNQGVIDELWLWGGPWFGYYEITMTGPSAFNTNSPPFSGNSCTKNLMVMGFSYERDVSEMIEDLGHGLEGTLSHFIGNNSTTPWGKFSLYDHISPGNAACGSIHFSPNSTSDYDWGNQRTVKSACQDWLNYPNLTGATSQINCSPWNCDGYQYKKWWLSHFPKVPGKTNGFWNNWWKYFTDLN